jgi:pimeloyl-ACP methyl ester carboxylesterase
MNNVKLIPQLQLWQQKGQYVKLNGHDIFYIDEGSKDKPVVLLIHGFPTSSWDWQGLWQTLSQDYRLVCLDMLGYGFSDKPNERSYSIHKQADIVEALVQELALDSFHVLAHDYGGTVAQELLARQNEGAGVSLWLSCCFLNGGLFPETHRALITQKILLSPLGFLANKLFSRNKFDTTFCKIFGADTQPSVLELDQYWQLINFNDGKHIFHNLITYISDRKQHRERWVAALQQAGIPLALINGSVDPVSGRHMVARYRELTCRLDYLAELPTIGHYPQVEDAPGVAEHFLKFIQSNGKST